MNEVSIRDRWLGATCYLSVLVFIPIFASNKTTFLARHCRQGFALFFAEMVALLILRLIEETLGRIPVIGFILSILLYLVVSLVFLTVSVLGFFKALSGVSWRVPFLDDLSESVPIHGSDDVTIDTPAE